MTNQTQQRNQVAFRVVLPADTPNVDYAVRCLLGGDANAKSKLVVDVQADLTPEQTERLQNITPQDLIDLRNSVNPTTVFAVRDVLNVCPVPEKVKPSGQYLGCVQWFQHNVPEIIVRRDAHDRATYFERDLPPAENVLWDNHYSQYVETGYWKEITEQEAKRRIEANRKVPQRGLECENPGCRLKGKIEDLDSPFMSIPCRGCGSNSASEFVYPSGFRIGDRVKLKHAPRIYNRDQGLRAGQTGRVMEPPNPDTWPADAVQITIDGGQGAIDAECLEKVYVTTSEPIRLPVCNQQLYTSGGDLCPRKCEICDEGPCTQIPVIIGVDWASGPDLHVELDVAKQPIATETGFPKYYVMGHPLHGSVDGRRWYFIERLSDHEAAFMEQPGVAVKWFDWHSSAFPGDHNVRSGTWVETTKEKAMWPGKYPEQPVADVVTEPDQHVELEVAPKPGIDWNTITVADSENWTIEAEHRSPAQLQLEMRDKFDEPGIWVYLVASELRIADVKPDDKQSKHKFPVQIPCARLCDIPRVKWPVGYRAAQMPKDYGKKVTFFSDHHATWGSGTLAGEVLEPNHKKIMLVQGYIENDPDLGELNRCSSDRVFILDTKPETI